MIDLYMKGLNSFGLLLARLLVGGELSAAPALVLSLIICFLHQLDDEVLDHLLHLGERISLHAHSQCGEHGTAQGRGTLLKVRRDTSLVLGARVGTEQCECWLLQQTSQVLVGVA